MLIRLAPKKPFSKNHIETMPHRNSLKLNAPVKIAHVTRLALSNCSVPEIAAIAGHAMATVQRILDAHDAGGRVELAEPATKRLSAAYG